jgi:hypothetical protein
MAGLSGVDGTNRGKIFSISKAVKSGNFPEGTDRPPNSHPANVSPCQRGAAHLPRSSLRNFLSPAKKISLSSFVKLLNILWIRAAEVSPANSLAKVRMRLSGVDDFTLPIQNVAHDRLQPVRVCYHHKHFHMIYL